MKEIKGNILDQHDADAICVTTNGIVKANGELVMGAGIAKVFRDTFNSPIRPRGTLAAELGRKALAGGNHVHTSDWQQPEGENEDGVLYGAVGWVVVSFPTKEHWNKPSLLWLIKRSAIELVALADREGWKKIVLTRPGCGNGGLDWELQVKPLIEPLLDDRFYIITPEVR